MDGMYSTEEIKGSISILLVLWMEIKGSTAGLMDGMYSTEEIKGSISILLVLWMGCTLQRRLKVVFLYCWSYGWNVLYRGD